MHLFHFVKDVFVGSEQEYDMLLLLLLMMMMTWW